MSDKERLRDDEQNPGVSAGRAAAEPPEGGSAAEAAKAKPEQPGDETRQEDPGQSAQAKPEEKSEQEKLTAQVAELNDRLLRTAAEYDNFRKRSSREREAIYPQATSAAVAKFLPIIDTFERALSAPCSDPEFKKGVEMILQNFRDALLSLGVAEFGEAGETFNPEMHNAVMHEEDENSKAGVITEVFQKGYKMGDRILRHAMVKVAN